MTWRDVLADAEQELIKAGVEDARVNAEYLAAHVLALRGRLNLRPKLDREISDSQADDFNRLIIRRKRREPLQYILGEWEFFGLPIKVSPDALIPRPETEILVEQTLVAAFAMRSDLTILDIGTGTGCIALALAKHLPHATIVAIDKSVAAIELARENGRLLGISNASFQGSDIFSDEWVVSARHYFDLVVSNPPYISQSEFDQLEPELKDFEPRIALTDDADGLTFYKRIAQIAPGMLAPNGRILLEVGYDTSGAVTDILGSAGFVRLHSTRDLAGIPRVVAAGLRNGKNA